MREGERRTKEEKDKEVDRMERTLNLEACHLTLVVFHFDTPQHLLIANQSDETRMPRSIWILHLKGEGEEGE